MKTHRRCGSARDAHAQLDNSCVWWFSQITSAAVFGQGGVEIWSRTCLCDYKDIFELHATARILLTRVSICTSPFLLCSAHACCEPQSPREAASMEWWKELGDVVTRHRDGETSLFCRDSNARVGSVISSAGCPSRGAGVSPAKKRMNVSDPGASEAPVRHCWTTPRPSSLYCTPSPWHQRTCSRPRLVRDHFPLSAECIESVICLVSPPGFQCAAALLSVSAAWMLWTTLHHGELGFARVVQTNTNDSILAEVRLGNVLENLLARFWTDLPSLTRLPHHSDIHCFLPLGRQRRLPNLKIPSCTRPGKWAPHLDIGKPCS